MLYLCQLLRLREAHYCEEEEEDFEIRSSIRGLRLLFSCKIEATEFVSEIVAATIDKLFIVIHNYYLKDILGYVCWGQM